MLCTGAGAPRRAHTPPLWVPYVRTYVHPVRNEVINAYFREKERDTTTTSILLAICTCTHTRALCCSPLAVMDEGHFRDRPPSFILSTQFLSVLRQQETKDRENEFGDAHCSKKRATLECR